MLRGKLLLLGIAAALSGIVVSGCGDSENYPTGRIAPGDPETAAGDGHTANEILVVVFSGYSLSSLAADFNMTLTDSLVDQVTGAFQTPPGTDLYQLEQDILADPRVAGACLNYIATDSETRQSSMAFDEGLLDAGEFYDQGLLRRLGLERAHQISQGQGVVIAILDTGADLDHPVLAGKINPFSYDFIDNDNQPGDVPDGLDSDNDGLVDEGLGHGSHVAGLASMVAPQASLMVLRVLDSDGRGPAFRIARAIEYAADRGAHIINMSFGMTSGPYAVDQAISYARLRGSILVASAGNWGAAQPQEYPASNTYVWAIAASDSADSAASFTSYSAHVALCAPGTRVLSAYWNGGYAVWSGTSMSAPLVAGAAALLRQLHPAWTSGNILWRLRANVDPVQPINPDQVGLLGSGRLDVGAAVNPDGPSVSGGDPGEMYWGH